MLVYQPILSLPLPGQLPLYIQCPFGSHNTLANQKEKKNELVIRVTNIIILST